MRLFLKSCVKFYRLVISPVLISFFGGRCRYEPSCSHYAEMILQENLPLSFALKKILFRFLSCHPLSGKGGVDFPPTTNLKVTS